MTSIQTIHPSVETLGPLQVRRLLPARERQMVGPFIFMDHGGPTEVPRAQAQGVPEHPHAGLATFTYLLAGTVIHRDSAGHIARIEAGDIALMTAGRGITHEERPDREDPSPTRTASFIQMWLALPDALEDVSPDFECHRASKLPLVESAGMRARILIGSAWGARAPTRTYTDTLFADLACIPQSSVSLPADVEERAFYLLEGDAMVADKPIKRHTLAVIEGGNAVTLSTRGGCRAILLGGARFTSQRIIGGSFVASSMKKLAAHQDAYRSGRFPKIERDFPTGNGA